MIFYWLPVILILPYVLTLFLIYRRLAGIKDFIVTSEPSTFISIVIACRNEEKNLPFLLNSLSLQDYPENRFEIIVVDDNSTDRTKLFAFESKNPGNLLVIGNSGSGKKQAIRTGISKASGSLVLTTDADCTMGKSWIRTISAYYEKEKASMIVCPVMIGNNGGFSVRFQALEFLSLQGITAGTVLSGNATMCNGANLAFEKEAYLDHSDELHDEIASGDDVFLLHSMKKDKKSKITWLESPEAIVTTAPSDTLNKYFKQRKRWISKAKAYTDRDSIFLGFVTFVTILMQAGTLIASLADPAWFKIFLLIFLLKSIPDFLILANRSAKYGQRKLMTVFLPAQVIYPFYVLRVVLYLISGRKN